MYDPQVGQFLSEDPIGFDANDPNLKRMVGNNLPNRTDPFGLEASTLVWAAPPVNAQIEVGAQVFSQQLPKASFETVKQVEDELNKSPAAAEILKVLKERGLTIEIDQKLAGEGTANRARFDPYGNDGKGVIKLNNTAINTLSGAAGYLLFELVRATNQAEQLALDKKVATGEIKSPAEYADECEKLTFKYMIESVTIAQEAMKNHGWGPKGDLGYGPILAAAKTEAQWIAWAKANGHYKIFLINYQIIKKSANK
jgi:uncharacterized protein RhaS with RHS repeats